MIAAAKPMITVIRKSTIRHPILLLSVRSSARTSETIDSIRSIDLVGRVLGSAGCGVGTGVSTSFAGVGGIWTFVRHVGQMAARPAISSGASSV
jgi:hypothetical protein